ncbi:MAG: hypothetical protein AB7L90_02545 [Hyphomicrobiaceae bacterium]
MPNDVKAVLSVVTILIGVAVAYWEASIGKGHLFWLVIGFSVFAVIAMWVFPEAQTKKKDLARKQGE